MVIFNEWQAKFSWKEEGSNFFLDYRNDCHLGSSNRVFAIFEI